MNAGVVQIRSERRKSSLSQALFIGLVGVCIFTIVGCVPRPSNFAGKRSQTQLNQDLVGAANEGDLEKAETAKREGADVNAMLVNVGPPLLEAACNGHDQIVELLINSPGIELDTQLKGAMSSLWCAARFGHVDVVKLLLDTKTLELNSRDGPSETTPLQAATYRGHLQVVKILAATPGVDTNAKCKVSRVGDNFEPLVTKKCDAVNGMTLAMEAAYYGSMEMMEILISSPGFDLNVKDENGKTPIWVAAARNQIAIVKALLKVPEVDLNSRDDSGMTPLRVAAELGHLEVVRLIARARGVDLEARIGGGRTLPELAKFYGKWPLAEILESAGAPGSSPKGLAACVPICLN